MTDDFKYTEAYYYMDGERVSFHVDDIQDQGELHRIRGLALRSSVFSIDGVALELVNMRQNNPDHANYMRRKDRIKSDFEANAREALTRREPIGIHKKLQKSILWRLERATEIISEGKNQKRGILRLFTNYFEGDDKPIPKTLCEVSDYQWDLQVPRFLPGNVFTRNDVSGRSNKLGHYGREPDIAFEVINTVMPEERVFNGLVEASSITPLLVVFFPIPYDENVKENKFVKTYGDHSMRVTHYIWDGAYWKNGRRVEPSDQLSVYEKFAKDINNARHPSAYRPKANQQKQLSLG